MIMGLLVFFLVALSAVIVRQAYLSGKADQKLTSREQEHETLRKAGSLRDRLRRNHAYAKRVRKRFTR